MYQANQLEIFDFFQLEKNHSSSHEFWVYAQFVNVHLGSFTHINN